MKGIEDAGGVLELVIDGVLTVSPLEGSRVAIWIPERKSSPRSSSQFSCAVPDLPGTRSTQAGRGMILPACQVYDAGELTWAPAVSVLVVPHMLVNPQHPHACEAGGVSDSACRHGLMWDHTVFHVVASCRANPAMVAPSKRNCRIAQRIARTPRRALGAHTEWFCSVKVAIWQVCSRHIHRRLCHRIRAGTPAQGASITSTTTRPWPCAIQPTTRAPRQLVARLNIEHESIWGASYAHQMEALQTDEQITPITTIKRHRAAGKMRHRPRPFEDSGGRSPLIIKDLDLYTQPPTNNRSPTLNSEEPL